MNSALNSETRFGIHKETENKTEAFMLFPKKQYLIELIKENIRSFKEPTTAQVNKIKAAHPDVSAMMAACRSNDVKSYAKPGFILFRKSVYTYHLYQFVRNDHSKIEITALHKGKKRKKERVYHELEQVLDKVTFAVKHVDYFYHSLKS